MYRDGIEPPNVMERQRPMTGILRKNAGAISRVLEEPSEENEDPNHTIIPGRGLHKRNVTTAGIMRSDKRAVDQAYAISNPNAQGSMKTSQTTLFRLTKPDRDVREGDESGATTVMTRNL